MANYWKYLAYDNIRRAALPVVALAAVCFIGDAGLTGVVKMVTLGFSLAVLGANIAAFSFHSTEFQDERALAEIFKAVCILVGIVIAGVYFAQFS